MATDPQQQVEQEMTPEVAFNVLVQATGHPTLALNRADHQAVSRALEVIKSLVDVAAAAGRVVEAVEEKKKG